MFKEFMYCLEEPFEGWQFSNILLNFPVILQEEFTKIMKTLPVSVSEEEINEVVNYQHGTTDPSNHLKMFCYADRNHDGMISYDEFQVMVSPPDIPRVERPHIGQLVFESRN